MDLRRFFFLYLKYHELVGKIRLRRDQSLARIDGRLSYDSDDWNEAREQLLQLLKIDQRNASEADLRSYLSCCAESVGFVHPLPDLKDTVNDFYLRYGMENSSKN